MGKRRGNAAAESSVLHSKEIPKGVSLYLPALAFGAFGGGRRCWNLKWLLGTQEEGKLST